MNSKGGVSPAKLRASEAKSRRGGAEAGKATTKTTSSGMVRKKYLGGRGGYAKSTGVRGAGGRNVGGYNIHTRFVPRKTPTAPSGGGTSTSTPQKPYSFDKDGDIIINNYLDGKGGTASATATAGSKTQPNNNMSSGWIYKQDPDKVTKEKREFESYDDFWVTRVDDKSKWSPGMKGFLDGVDMEDANAVAEARKKWEKLSREKESERNKDRQWITKTEAGKKWKMSYIDRNGVREYTSGWILDE